MGTIQQVYDYLADNPTGRIAQNTPSTMKERQLANQNKKKQERIWAKRQLNWAKQNKKEQEAKARQLVNQAKKQSESTARQLVNQAKKQSEAKARQLVNQAKKEAEAKAIQIYFNKQRMAAWRRAGAN